MKTQANRSSYLPLLIVGIAEILFSTAGIAAIMGSLPASTDGSGDILAADRSSRVINHAGPASWRPGERVIVIDGANPSNR